jgi:hypothetical protein
MFYLSYVKFCIYEVSCAAFATADLEKNAAVSRTCNIFLTGREKEQKFAADETQIDADQQMRSLKTE